MFEKGPKHLEMDDLINFSPPKSVTDIDIKKYSKKSPKVVKDPETKNKKINNESYKIDESPGDDIDWL